MRAELDDIKIAKTNYSARPKITIVIKSIIRYSERDALVTKQVENKGNQMESGGKGGPRRRRGRSRSCLRGGFAPRPAQSYRVEYKDKRRDSGAPPPLLHGGGAWFVIAINRR